MVDWVISYLTARSFRVKVNSTLSKPRGCPSGVPQGSCLGPLLFCLFINDIGSVIPSDVTYKLYADDLKMYSCTTEEGSAPRLQLAVDAVAKWCDTHGMLLSIPKCTVVNSNGSTDTPQLLGQDLSVLPSMKDLGVLMDPSLKFSKHVFNVFKSVSLICNLIFRMFIITRPDFYRQLYVSLIVPRLVYCSQVWSPRLKKYISLLERARRMYERRVASRYGIPRDSFRLIIELHAEADDRLFRSLMNRGTIDRYFRLTPRVRGDGVNVNAHQVARSEAVAATYAWRQSKRIHDLRS